MLFYMRFAIHSRRKLDADFILFGFNAEIESLANVLPRNYSALSSLRQMTLVRHFEAFVFPLVIHLRRSLFTDLAVFSSDAAVSGVGAAADSGAIQREEQVKRVFRDEKIHQITSLGDVFLLRTWQIDTFGPGVLLQGSLVITHQNVVVLMGSWKQSGPNVLRQGYTHGLGAIPMLCPVMLLLLFFMLNSNIQQQACY